MYHLGCDGYKGLLVVIPSRLACTIGGGTSPPQRCIAAVVKAAFLSFIYLFIQWLYFGQTGGERINAMIVIWGGGMMRGQNS
jgi:hypothetical protein